VEKFEPLTVDLIAEFNKPFARLPAHLKQRVSRVFRLKSWDSYVPRERTGIVFSHDLENDPASQVDVERLFELHYQIGEIEARLYRDAVARWGLPKEFLGKTKARGPKTAAIVDVDAHGKTLSTTSVDIDARDLRIWFHKRKRQKGVFPSLKDVWLEFAAPRGLGRQWCRDTLKTIRADFRQKAGRPRRPKNK
jgi:hypothetical protein